MTIFPNPPSSPPPISPSSNTTHSCPILHLLPPELRLKIYLPLLTFRHPIKRRQLIPGSRDTAILRTCRQIHAEALPVLWESNEVVVARNDFCGATDAALKTPVVCADLARRLRVASFSPSIACTVAGLVGGDEDGPCDVCRPDARGLFCALAAMPRLRSVRVDYAKHRVEVDRLREMLAQADGEVALVPVEAWRGFTGFVMVGEMMGRVEVVFRCDD